ncbi:unnamed protein product [Mesocestoides corti]|uniref:Ubiquitin-like domain-containing protein n=1 Tax=Mesocestoides corti TaxID=53468 RepID=A0A0R3U4Q1_MESCO|nr:unnamed protein product [Mesocestoides corti]
MTTLVEALQRKFKDLAADELSPECKLKPASRAGGTVPVCTRVIAMDHQEISCIGDPKEMGSIFEDVRELDVSTNHIRFWSDVFVLLESSPQLQFLNLSYNPLHESSLFCESDRLPDLSTQSALSHNNNCCADLGCDLNLRTNSSNSAINLLVELSLSEYERQNEQCKLVPVCLSHQLNTLMLNSTHVPWKRVLILLNYLPNLTTLHTALNDYRYCCQEATTQPDRQDVANCASSFPNLTHLYFSENRIDDWATVCCLGRHFPGLKHLVLLKNPLPRIQRPPGDGSDPSPQIFANLIDLNLTETQISTWECIDALTWWMPFLSSLRLGKNIPLVEVGGIRFTWTLVVFLQGCDAQTVRYDVIARMPSLTSYNITPISDDERERAERDFVRRFGQLDAIQRPYRYWELESLHGHLPPLASVNLSPKRNVRLRVVLDNQEKWHTCCLRRSIAKIRREVCALFEMPAEDVKRTRLVYYDMDLIAAQGPEEMRNLSRLLYTYHPADGDTIEITLRS